MTGIEVTIERFGFAKGSVRDRVRGDMPLIESKDVAGDTPSETRDRLFRCYTWDQSLAVGQENAPTYKRGRRLHH